MKQVFCRRALGAVLGAAAEGGRASSSEAPSIGDTHSLGGLRRSFASSPWRKSRRRTEAGEAPRWQGATTENIGQYLREKQRSQRGCIAGRMQPDFRHGLLKACTTS